MNSSPKASVRILPHNKVYRQLFDSQVQLSDAYNRVRSNQLSQSVNITSRTQSIPIVRNIRSHDDEKRQWLSSMPFENDPKINPVTILYHDEIKRRQNDEKQEIDELKREVFNLPDEIEQIETETSPDHINRGSVTERLATNRKTQFNNLWKEFTEKISNANQNLLNELEKLTRQCTSYYEQGGKEIDEQLQNLIYQHDLTSLTIKSFQKTFNLLEQFLPPRLEQIQEYCQTIEQIESQRTNEIRDLFKYYSDRLYKTHHLSEKETAYQLEKQANELNTQFFENRRIYTELEARLLAGETVRAHQYQVELLNYQLKWRDESWIVHKQTWISKLSISKANLESTILSTCQPIGNDISLQTNSYLKHINTLKSFVPPKSTRENAKKWYNEGYDIVSTIVNKWKELVQQIKKIINDEIDLLKKEKENIREKVIRTQVYNEEQTKIAIERDIDPLVEERKQLLQESISDRIEVVYEQLTNIMYDVLSRLLTFIQPAAEQWDEHQIRLERVALQLFDMIRDYRRPYDIQNEKKLTKLDATLDEMRCASNETALTRLLNSAYEQLDNIKAGYVQFYDMEHSIVNKYSNMINGEVNRYKEEILNYFHAQEIDSNKMNDHHLSSLQYYKTNSLGITYELEGYLSSDSNLTGQISTGKADKQSRVSTSIKSSSDTFSHEQDQSQIQIFLTEDSTLINNTSTKEIENVPFYSSFIIPSNLVDSLMLTLCRAFLDFYDQWKQETTQRADAVIYTKHDELNKEMDFQMHLHEPRRVRIETDIHNVRAAEIVMHDERIERHLRGVQETLEQMDADYSRMLNEFNKLTNKYRDDISSLEQVFINATTSTRLSSLEDGLAKQRDKFMDYIRTSLRNFRKRFDEVMQYLQHANIKFRKSLKLFSEGGNFSREEIEICRKKLEKTALQIDKAESAILHELQKLEKKQLDEAMKIMSQFQDRFTHHMTDLKFIELTNRWISESQVKIKSEVAVSNQQAHALKTLILLYQGKIDAIQNPNIDKQVSSINEVQELFKEIVLSTYERALYLKCLNNELTIPASIVTILKDKGLITEKALIKDLHVIETDDTNLSRRPSRLSEGVNSNNDEMKSVKFASSSSQTFSSSRQKVNSIIFTVPTDRQPEDIKTISTIRSILHNNELAESDEITEPVEPLAKESNMQSMISDSSKSSKEKKLKNRDKNKSSMFLESSINEVSGDIPAEPIHRARTRDEIYELYCVFGEKKHSGENFLSKILNILRESTEGLLTHAEVFYKHKGSRPVTRPQALRERFDEFAKLMIDKLKRYEEQCRAYHKNCVNEFRNILELFERASTLMAKIDLDEQINHGFQSLTELKQQFDTLLNEKLNEFEQEKEKNFHSLRPVYGQPAKKDHLKTIDDQEKLRQNNLQNMLEQIRSNTIKDAQKNGQETVESLATNSERLLILFDEILTADELKRTKIPMVKQSLSELIKRQQAGKSLEPSEPTPIIDRKPGHWAGLPLLDDQLYRQRESIPSKKRSSVSSQRQKTSASIVTQKTTLPQIETIKQRDEAYQKYKELYIQVLTHIEAQYSTAMAEFDRYRSYWKESIDKLQNLRIN